MGLHRLETRARVHDEVGIAERGQRGSALTDRHASAVVYRLSSPLRVARAIGASLPSKRVTWVPAMVFR